MKKKLSLFLILIMITVLAAALFACTKDTTEIEDPPTRPTLEQITVPQAMQKTYEGLLYGGDVISETTTFAVDSFYTIYTKEINYSITYKANYETNPQDSEIYLAIFDNESNRNRVSIYYDKANLYILTDFEKKFIEDFSKTAMFDAFFDIIRYADLTNKVFSQSGANLFDKDNSSINLGLFLNASDIKKIPVTETRDSLEYKDIDLVLISDTVNTYMDNYLGEIGDKFDVITQKYLNFKLNSVIESRFSSINVNTLNMQTESGVADYVNLEASGSFTDKSKYKIEARLNYNLESKTAIDEKNSFDAEKFTHVKLGQKNFMGTINIPALSKEDFDISIVTNLDAKDNQNNEMSIDIQDAKKNHLMGAYYRDQILFADISGLETQYVKDAIDLSAFNLPKVFFDGINLTSLINAFYNSGVRMLSTILDKPFDTGEIQNENLYAIIMENFGNDGNVIHYTITEELIQLIREDETRIAALVAQQLGIPLEKLDSILGEDFFELSTLKISYNLDTGTIGISYYYNKELIFKMSVDEKEYIGVTFPSDTTLETSAYNKLIVPDDIKTEINVEFEVTNAKEYSDMSKILGAFIGDPSGKNTPYNIITKQKLVLDVQASERFVNIGSDTLISEYRMRFDLYSKEDPTNILLSVYSNKQNGTEYLVEYGLPIGKEPYQNTTGIKYKIKKSVVSASLNKILGENNAFEDTSLFGIISEILNGKASHIQASNSDGYFNFVLDVVTDPETGEKNDPVKNLIGVSDLRASVKTRFLFEEVVLNDVVWEEYSVPSIKDGTFESAVGIDSLYSPNSKWKDKIDVTFGIGTIQMVPNYVEESINISGDKKTYTPQCELFGNTNHYMLTIYKEIGTYTVKRLLSDTIIIDPSETDKLPTEIEVEFTNGKTGKLTCKINGLTDDNVTYEGLNLDVFANDKKASYTLQIGDNSILEIAFTVYVAVNNRTVLPLVEDGEELTIDENVPVIGTITIDPYAYAMKKMDTPSYNFILEGIIKQAMKINFYNVYYDIAQGKEITFNEEGINFFYLEKLDLFWEFDENQIKHSGGVLYAYSYFGEGSTAIKIAIKINIMAKNVNYVVINDEEINRYTIDSLVTSTYGIPTQTGIGSSVTVYFGDGTSRIVRLLRPEQLSDEDYYQNYLPTELAWYIPNPDYMANVTLEYGASTLFGDSMRNSTYAYFKIGTLDKDRVDLMVEVPERRESADTFGHANAIQKIIDNGDGTFSTSNITSVNISPVKFGEDDDLYSSYSINPYDEDGKLPNEIFMKVYRKNSNNNDYIMKKYNVNWLTTAGIGGEETNILYIDNNGYARLAHPTTDENDFYIYGVIGDGAFNVVIKTIVKNLASKLRSIQYEGMEVDAAEMAIDAYKSYNLPAAFTATLESGESVYRSDIAWMVQKEGDTEWLPIDKPLYGDYNAALYGENGKYLFGYEGGTYILRYILEASGSVLSQSLFIYVTVESRTIVSDTINIYETGRLVTGYNEINYYKADSDILLSRINALIDDTQKRLRVGIGFEEARTDLILDRYNLYVDWVRANPADANYTSSLDYLAYILKNPQGEESMRLVGTIYTGTVNEQSLSVMFSLANLVISNITLNKAEYSESVYAVELPQKENDGRISMALLRTDEELVINIPKIFALTVPVNNVERYATPYQYINYVFEKIIMVYYNGTTDSEITPMLDFGTYSERTFNQKVLGITDGLYLPTEESTTIIHIKKLSAGSAQENIKVRIVAKIDIRESTGRNVTAELYNELGESCTTEGYILPTYIDVPYRNSGVVRYHLASTGWSTSENIGSNKATNIEITSLNVLSPNAISYAFYYVLPMQGLKDGVQDEGYYYLTVNIPRKNIKDVNYTAMAEESLYDITDGYITINNAYLFYNNQISYTSGATTYNPGFDYTKLPDVINAKIIPDYFDSTSVNYFHVSWIPVENAITETDIVNGISRGDKRALATATILSYYNELGEHVTQTVTVYIEMEAMVFSGIEYAVKGVSLDIRKDEDNVSNTIVIDPYDDKIGYNGIFKLPTIGLVINFENNEKYTVTPAANSPIENPITDDIRKFDLLDNDMQYIRTITEIPYGYSGYTLTDSNLPINGLLYIRMVMFTGQEMLLTINILSRVVDQAHITNTVKINDELQYIGLPRLYYIDPYNSITHKLPDTASIVFVNSDEATTLPIIRWEILGDSNEYKNINSSPYFYSLTSTINGEYSYAYYDSESDGYKGGVFTLRAYISMGTHSGGINIGEQGFDILVIILNRSLKTSFITSHEYNDPIEGLLADIGGNLEESMFVDYDKYYTAEYFAKGSPIEIFSSGIPVELYYSNVCGEPMIPNIDWSRYVDDSIISYEGFSNRNVDGYLNVENTNINYMYNRFKSQVETTYAELIKSMTWDSFFTTESGKMVPLNYYNTQTINNLKQLLVELEIAVKNQTFRLVIEKFNSAENTAALAKRMESVLLRSVMSNNSHLNNEEEGVAFLYDMLKQQHSNNDMKAEDRAIYLNWVDSYNNFKGNYTGYVENIDAEKLTPYQSLKRDLYDKAYENLYFYGEEYNFNDALYAESAKKLANYINNAIWLKMYDMATKEERLYMSTILGQDSSVASRANALKILMISDLKTIGSYGEYANAKISAPQVTFDNFKDGLDTFYFNIYTNLALDEEVYAQFLLNKEAIFEELIASSFNDVIDAYRKGIISTTLQEYFNVLKAKIVNTMVPTDENGNTISFYYDEAYHVYDYMVDRDTYLDDNKKEAAIDTYISYLRENAISNISPYNNESTAKQSWDSRYGAYQLKANTVMIAVMDEILENNFNVYIDAMYDFKLYLQDEASKRFDISIEYADKLVNGIVVQSLIDNPRSVGPNNINAYSVFADVYGPSIGEYNTGDDIYNLIYESLDVSKRTILAQKHTEFSSGTDSFLRTIHYFLYEANADPIIRIATQDFFYLKLCQTAGKNFYDLLYQQSKDSDNENKESLAIYLANVELGYENATYETELKKARVFRNLQSYYANVTGQYKGLIQEIYDSVLIDIKDEAYDTLYSGLFREFALEKENLKESKGNVKAIAFDYLLKAYEKDADTIIEFYNNEISAYVDRNMYKYAESLYNKMYEQNAFVYETSDTDPTEKNYLDLTQEQESLVERQAVNYYYNNLATSEEKLNISASSRIFGEYIVGGKYSAPEGVYEFLIKRYDIGEEFISKLTACKYYCKLNYAAENVTDTINDKYQDPSDILDYIEMYYNVYQEKIGSMGGQYNEDIITEFAKKDYINYQIEQIVLRKYILEKLTLTNGTLIPQGKEELYYKLYDNEYKTMLNNTGVTLSGAEALYYRLFSTVPSELNITAEELEDILYNHMVLSGDKDNYYSIFALAKDKLDELENASYQARLENDKTRNYNVYSTIKDKLLKKMLELIDSTVAEVEIQEGYITVFDELIAPYYANEELLGYNYDDLDNARDTKLADDVLVGEYDYYLTSANAIQKGFLQAIYRQEELRLGDGQNVNHLKTISHMALCIVINEAKLLAFSIDYDLIELSDIQNDIRTIFNDDAKKQYLDIFIDNLKDKNFLIAAAYIEKMIKNNRYSTNFVVVDNLEGMTEEEQNNYWEQLAQYVDYSNKIYNKLLLTSANDTAKEYLPFITSGKFLTTMKSQLSNKLNMSMSIYTEGVVDNSDTSYQEVLQRMVNEAIVEYKFYTQDHIVGSDVIVNAKNKHLLYFDVQLLQDEENSSTQDINKIYLTNLNKKDNEATLITRDGFRFVYPQIEIAYVDYYGETDVTDAQDKYDGIETSENKFLNKITIDPLNPDLPSTVHAYGIYRKMSGGGEYGILDVGMVNVTYDEIFLSLEGEYAGNALEGDSSSSYQITAVNNKNDEFLISLTVFYLNRTVQSYYVSGEGYTSSGNEISGGEYSKYYNLFDSSANTNRIIIDPTLEETVDKDNKTYRMPSSIVANYIDYENDTYRRASPKTMSYYNVVWDLQGVNYSLSGLQERSLRILSYYTNVGDGTYNKVVYDYANNRMTITKYLESDNSRISVNIFTGIPSNSIWNVTLTVNVKTVDKIYIKNEYGTNTLLAKFISDEISGDGNDERWLVAESEFTVNPYYVEFFKGIVLEFSDGDSYEISTDIDWIYHPSNGVDKLREIVNKSISEPNNRYIVAGFNYICENIWIKLMVDDIEIVRPIEIDENGDMVAGYIDGGTIYLLADTSEQKEAQLASFYPYMYYNFSTDKYNEDWRKVPLNFNANAIRNIVIKENNVYPGILATLGNNSSGFNIMFTIKVISPKLFASLGGENNHFIVYDALSMPVDGNSRVISSSSDMPQIFGNNFVQVENGLGTMFHILNTSYDVVNEKVIYECRYYMDTTSEKIAGGEDGLMTLSFKTVLPLKTYNYTGIGDVKFVNTSSDNYLWKMVNSFEETDALYWKLGQTMTPSLLPQGYDTTTGERINMMWDLDNVNINFATGEEGYYTVRAYYYSSSAQWHYKEVNIHILREDITTEIVPDTALNKVYDGNKYTYDLDYELLIQLRQDGSFAPIDPANVTIEYRVSTSSEYNYSTTYRPLNAGTYYIRITLDDYNFYGTTIVTLTIEPFKIKGSIPGGLGGQAGLVTDIIFEGADYGNYIYYTYNGQTQGLVVSSGLPLVHVQNWPQTKGQKDSLYLSKLGLNPTNSEITIAKSASYNELFGQVTPATQVFLTKFKTQVREEYGIVSENELNARVFDLLDYNLYISEVVPTIIYKNMSGIVLEKEPVDVGTYQFSYNIEASPNNGNYIFDSRTTVMVGRIVIKQQDLTYSLASNNLIYNGAYQHPLINNLHLANGNLPTGVSVNYTYRYSRNNEWIETNQIKDVGTYYLRAEINGGSNYPSSTLENLSVYIVAQDLRIGFDETNTQSQYLNDIVDYGKHLEFSGLVGNDKANDFYAPIVSGNVQSYYTIGSYPIFIDGFKLDLGDAHTYTKFDNQTIYEIGGLRYYKLELKNATEPGSLYLQLDEYGEYVYRTLINKFNNYNIYISIDNIY
ncbi:MAG TPA: hypothetical protein VJ903_04865, partial [Clostridia bacterium]|nr:hypothetical protein [Clostridia bacterium]